MKNTYKILILSPFLLLLASCWVEDNRDEINPEDSFVGTSTGEILEMESGDTGGGWDEESLQNDSIRF